MMPITQGSLPEHEQSYYHRTEGTRYPSSSSTPNHAASPSQTSRPFPTYANSPGHQNPVPPGVVRTSSSYSQFAGETNVGAAVFISAEEGAQVYTQHIYVNHFNQPVGPPVVHSPAKRSVWGILGKKSRQTTADSFSSTTSSTSASSYGMGRNQPSPLTSNGDSPITDGGLNSALPQNFLQTSGVGHQEYSPQTALPGLSHPSQLPRLELPPYGTPSPPGRSWNPTSSPDGLTSPEIAHSPLRWGAVSSSPGNYTSSLVSEAVTTHELVTFLNASGAVLAGSLEGLVYRLVANCDLRKDCEYRDTVLISCADLISPEQLFGILSRRFYNNHPQGQVTVQHNILVLLMHWLLDRRTTLQMQLLAEIQSFCNPIPTRFPGTAGKVADILQLVDHLLKGYHHPLPSSLIVHDSPEMTPRNLAIALTLLEGNKYSALTHADYILHLKIHPNEYNPQLQTPPAADRVEAVFMTQNQIIQWVKESILRPGSVQGRAKALEDFMDTADECCKLCNFSSFIAIVSALHSGPIARLEMTKAVLGLRVQDRLKSLQDKMNPSSNSRNYRKSLEKVLKRQGRCVPWLAVHLNDLRQPLRENLPLKNVDGRLLINFERYVKFMDQIKKVTVYCAPDPGSFREEGQLAYLQNKLDNMALPKSDDDLMKLAEELEPRDSGEYKRLTQRDNLKHLGLLR